MYLISQLEYKFLKGQVICFWHLTNDIDISFDNTVPLIEKPLPSSRETDSFSL